MQLNIFLNITASDPANHEKVNSEQSKKDAAAAAEEPKKDAAAVEEPKEEDLEHEKLTVAGANIRHFAVDDEDEHFPEFNEDEHFAMEDTEDEHLPAFDEEDEHFAMEDTELMDMEDEEPTKDA